MQNAQKISSTPTFSEFDPTIIPFQDEVIEKIWYGLDYKLGTHEILLSGSVGSAKTILAAHIAVRHCLEFPNARVAICRRALPDLRDTIYQAILDHIEMDNFIEGRDFRKNDTRCKIRFLATGSEIVSVSWADRKYKKARSKLFSAAIIEEATENDDRDEEVVNEILMRCGRLTHVPHKFLLYCTNPDSPSHFLYRRFFTDKLPTRHVFFSRTEENPFLPPEYIEGLRRTLTEKMARRMLGGEWLDIGGETIYHTYGDHNEPTEDYIVNPDLPVYFTWDFNIGAGKPLSVAFFQIKDGSFHFFDEVVVEGARTEANMQEAENRGLFQLSSHYICHGDRSGSHQDTRSKVTDYEIIDSYMRRLQQSAPRGKGFTYERKIQAVNPPLRTRHNTVCAYLKNSLGEVRVFVYPRAKTLRQAFRLTKLKKGADYLEDDSKAYQHIGTAAGYAICYHDMVAKRGKTTQREG